MTVTLPASQSGTGLDRIETLQLIERRLLWLSSWMIHNANHLRPSRDGIKVGGHQSSCASVASIMTALYFDALRPQDRVAVKPHASPIFHALQYMLGNQTVEKLQDFRSLGGVQSYPSRTKDTDGVDFSTGSVGLGVAMTAFSSLVQDYTRMKGFADPSRPEGRMVAIVGDAELDEGNVFEALFEGWKHDFRNLWWVIDYNRQSLDSVVTDRLFGPIEGMFRVADWRVETLKYGQLLEAAFQQPGGDALRDWIDNCPNSRYSALTFKGGAAWRDALWSELGDTGGIKSLLDDHDDASLARLMTNLAGHDLTTLTDAFARNDDDQPTCFIAYTVKGYGLPLAGHKDNHSGLMTPDQIESLRASIGVPEGQEWDAFAGLGEHEPAVRSFIDKHPAKMTDHEPATVPVPDSFDSPAKPGASMSTQDGFGRVLAALAKDADSPLAERIVTTSPDVTVSTNLGGWVSKRGIYDRRLKPDVFREEKVASAYKWTSTPEGQHIELGIAENNLFINLAALGLSHKLFGARLLPVGTLYDPFIARGLDALNYACYQDARFMLVATPSGVTLAPEGGAHQSINTPLIGMGQPGLSSFEPAYVDELAAIMRWGFEHMQDKESGGSVYLRLSTRPLEQPTRETALPVADVIKGAYWLIPPADDADLALVACGPLVTEAREAHAELQEDCPGAGLLVITSPDLLHEYWAGQGGDSHIAQLLGRLHRNAGLVTVLDGHPASLSWIGSVRGHAIRALGVSKFGQSGDIPDLYALNHIDTDSILDAAADVLVSRLERV
ncbi:MAG: transketolase [Alphaproteobacteria bacterium]